MNYTPSKPTTILETISLECVLFLDIETVPMAPDFESMPEVFKPLWVEKSRKYSYEELLPEELFFERAGIHAEFGKVICISAGYYRRNAEGKSELRVRAFYGHDEKKLLEEFRDLLDKHYNDCNRHFLCAHNGIEFDFPYLARRMMINGIRLPNLLNVSGTKSWNNRWLIDTMELWKFGDYKEKTSLALLAACFGIESPKDDISGKDVARVYYQDNDLERIMNYCKKDVTTLAKLFVRFAGLAPVPETEVIYL